MGGQRWLLVAFVSLVCCTSQQPEAASPWTMPTMAAASGPARSGQASSRQREDRRTDPWFLHEIEAQPGATRLGEPDSPDGERLRGGAGPGGIWWIDDVAARAEARHARRSVVIDFWASWCPPCLLLDRKTFDDPQVIAELSAFFVPVKLDVSEETEFHKARLRHYQVHSLPAIVVLSPDGHELDRIKRFIGPDDFLDRLRAARARVAGERRTNRTPAADLR